MMTVSCLCSSSCRFLGHGEYKLSSLSWLAYRMTVIVAIIICTWVDFCFSVPVHFTFKDFSIHFYRKSLLATSSKDSHY